MGFRPGVVPGQQQPGQLPGQAGGEGDDALVVLLQQVMVNARLGIKALHEGSGHHLDEVLIAGLILAEQDKMVVAVDFVDFIEAGTGVVSYKCGEKFYGEYDDGIMWNDPDINVKWPIKELGKTDIILAEKDRNLQSFNEFKNRYGGF